MRKFLSILLFGIIILGLTGCGKSEDKNSLLNQAIWDDAQKDEIYNIRIFFNDSVSMYANHKNSLIFL